MLTCSQRPQFCRPDPACRPHVANPCFSVFWCIIKLPLKPSSANMLTMSLIPNPLNSKGVCAVIAWNFVSSPKLQMVLENLVHGILMLQTYEPATLTKMRARLLKSHTDSHGVYSIRALHLLSLDMHVDAYLHLHLTLKSFWHGLPSLFSLLSICIFYLTTVATGPLYIEMWIEYWW